MSHAELSLLMLDDDIALFVELDTVCVDIELEVDAVLSELLELDDVWPLVDAETAESVGVENDDEPSVLSSESELSLSDDSLRDESVDRLGEDSLMLEPVVRSELAVDKVKPRLDTELWLRVDRLDSVLRSLVAELNEDSSELAEDRLLTELMELGELRDCVLKVEASLVGDDAVAVDADDGDRGDDGELAVVRVLGVLAVLGVLMLLRLSTETEDSDDGDDGELDVDAELRLCVEAELAEDDEVSDDGDVTELDELWL